VHGVKSLLQIPHRATIHSQTPAVDEPALRARDHPARIR
jgi:hypothetical protein